MAAERSLMHAYAPYAYAPYGAPPASAPVADYQWTSWGSSSRSGQPAEVEPDALQSRTLFFGRLSDAVTEDTLRALCEHHGDLKKVAVYPEKHMGFVEFYDLRHADAAREALKGTELEGKKIEVQFSAVKRPEKDGNMGTLYVRPTTGNSASTAMNDPNGLEAYRRLFAAYGDIKKVSFNRKRETEKFIEFHDLRDASKALESLNGHNFNGVTLQICFAQNASRTYNRDAPRPASRRTPESYGPYRGSAYSPATRGYAQSPYSPPMIGAAAGFGPYSVCQIPGYAAAFGYQQPPNGYAHGWPSTQPAASSPYAAPRQTAAMYPPGGISSHWRQAQ